MGSTDDRTLETLRLRSSGRDQVISAFKNHNIHGKAQEYHIAILSNKEILQCSTRNMPRRFDENAYSCGVGLVEFRRLKHCSALLIGSPGYLTDFANKRINTTAGNRSATSILMGSQRFKVLMILNDRKERR